MAAIVEYVQVQPAEILLVEDNPGDVRLMREALRESKVINQLHAVSDGHRGAGLSAQTRQIRQCKQARSDFAGS